MPSGRKTNTDNQNIILNPNCSEVIWRLQGYRGKYEGSNQEPFAVFIEDILKIFSTLKLSKEEILTAIPDYIKGDGGPDTLEWSFKYAQDLVAGIRDPRELEFDEDLDNQIVERGYDTKISKHWKPLVKGPRDTNKPLSDAEKYLQQIWQTAQGSTSKKLLPRKASKRILKGIPQEEPPETLIDYHGILLPESEMKVIKELEHLIGRQIPRKTQIQEILCFKVTTGSIKNHIGGLSLSHLGLDSVPESIGTLRYLTTLNLSSNQLTKLPLSISQLGRLQVLLLHDNLLTNIPSNFDQLTQLRHINLNSNHFIEFPDCILQPSLRELWICNNQLQNIPPKIELLKNLKDFYAYKNNITELPIEIGELYNLIRLEISDNQLTRLPHSMVKMEALGFLDLDKNPIQIFPKFLADMPNLIRVFIGELQFPQLTEKDFQKFPFLSSGLHSRSSPFFDDLRT